MAEASNSDNMYTKHQWIAQLARYELVQGRVLDGECRQAVNR
jgi:hypothetical protein